MKDINLPEVIAMSVAVVLALSLVSVLAHAKMTQGGIPPGRKRQVLVSLWLLVLGLVALLLALRVVSGAPAIDQQSPAGGGMWLGLEPRQMIALFIAIVLLLLGYTRIRSIIQSLEAESVLAAPPTALTSEADQDT